MLRLAYLIQRGNKSFLILLALLMTVASLILAWWLNLEVFYKGLWVVFWIAGFILFLELLCWLIVTYAKDNEHYVVIPGNKVRKKNKDGLLMHLSEDLITGDAFDDIEGGDGD
jgi:hypothetical protein